jgi:hypothetical protein
MSALDKNMSEILISKVMAGLAYQCVTGNL